MAIICLCRQEGCDEKSGWNKSLIKLFLASASNLLGLLHCIVFGTRSARENNTYAHKRSKHPFSILPPSLHLVWKPLFNIHAYFLPFTLNCVYFHTLVVEFWGAQPVLRKGNALHFISRPSRVSFAWRKITVLFDAWPSRCNLNLHE